MCYKCSLNVNIILEKNKMKHWLQLLSGFCLFLLLLGSAHAHEMATMLEADIEDSAEREGIVLSADGIDVQESHNDIILHKAHNLAVCE